MGPFEYIKICLEWEHLKRTGLITIVVGTWLTLFNQGDVLILGDIGILMFGKIVLNYLTPFMVSNAGLLSRERSPTSDDSFLPHRNQLSHRLYRDIRKRKREEAGSISDKRTDKQPQ